MSTPYEFERKYRDQVLRCSSCGFCQAVCPLYGLTLRPALNARGKMLILNEVMAGELEMDQDLAETLFQCTLCASCTNTCPSGIRASDIIRTARQDLASSSGGLPAFEQLREVMTRSGNIYAEEEPRTFGRPLNQPAENVFFMGCVGAYREEEAVEEGLDLLDRLKVDYTLINEVCCSGVLDDLGYSLDNGLVSANVEAILAVGAKRVITGCPYCYRTFTEKEAYASLREAGVEVVHFSQFLAGLDLGIKSDRKVTYHDPCDLGRHAGIYEEPRQVIQRVAENFVELEHNRDKALCCGAGGGVRGAFPANSIALARRRLDEVEASGAEVVLTECNSCLHNLTNAKLRRHKFKIMTTAQWLNHLLEEGS